MKNLLFILPVLLLFSCEKEDCEVNRAQIHERYAYEFEMAKDSPPKMKLLKAEYERKLSEACD